MLFANRFVCCVCRARDRGVIVHHIAGWHVSHSHEPDNLAVLCSEHHDRAHTVSKLSRNLDAKTVRSLKQAWEHEVSLLDVSAILEALAVFQSPASVPACGKTESRFRISPTFHIGSRGIGDRPKRAASFEGDGAEYLYSGGDGLPLYLYVRDVMHNVLERLSVLNISNSLDRSVLKSLLKPGMFVLVQGLHTFKSAENYINRDGPGQIASGRRTTNNVSVEYSFDLYEGTSVSAISVWLRGSQDITSLLRVGSLSSEGGKLTVNCTVLGIAQGFYTFKTREYANAPFRRGFERVGAPEDFGDDDDPFSNDEAEEKEELAYFLLMFGLLATGLDFGTNLSRVVTVSSPCVAKSIGSMPDVFCISFQTSVMSS